MTASQCDRVLAVLRDGDWHDINEIHRRAGTMRLNSRISDLRARGHLIDCKPNGAKTRYRLTSTAGAPGTAPVEAAAGPPAVAAEQLTLDDARSARASGPEWS
ncbi:MAG: helix-turn-helix domain-containing protein [Solirubrobacteraceae bacterium]